MRNVRLSLIAAAVAALFSQSIVVNDAQAQNNRATSVQSSQARTQVQGNEKRYVSRTVRRVATPTRNARIYSAPRGATALRSRNWDSRTRWIVDRRTNTSYAVLDNGEVWFMDPSSGWGYTVDRYGRVYGADPRRNTIYAFSSLNSWRGDLFYFFNYYTPWDGHYTLRDYDYFYSSYYGRRYDYYDAGYAYRTLWDYSDDYFFSSRFNSTVNFHYYDSRYLRYDRGWRSDYYLSYLPSVYVAPIYRYQVVNNVVVVNNNYYGSAGSNGRGLPSARDAAVELARDISVPVGFASNTISRQEVQALSFSSDVQIPIEPVKVIDAQTFASTGTEAAIDIPGLDNTPVALTQTEQTQTLQQMDTIQPPNMEVAAVPEDFGAAPVGSEAEQVAAPSDPGAFAEVPTEQPVDTARAEPAFEDQKEPSYQEPVVQEPAMQEPVAQEQVQAMEEKPAYEEQPAYQEQAQESFKEPVYEEPAYQEPVSESRQEVDPVYQQEEQVFEDQKEPAYEQEQPVYQEESPAFEQREEPSYQQEEPVYQQQEEQSYQREEPAYQQQEQQSYQQEEPVYQQQEEQSYQREEPAYQQQEQQSYQQEEPVYQQQEEQSYQREEPAYQQQEQQSYQREEPQQQEQSYQREEPAQQQEQSYEAPAQSDERSRDEGGGE